MSQLIARLQILVWAFIYGGLLAATVGYAVQRGGDAWGWGLCAVGAVAVHGWRRPHRRAFEAAAIAGPLIERPNRPTSKHDRREFQETS